MTVPDGTATGGETTAPGSRHHSQSIQTHLCIGPNRGRRQHLGQSTAVPVRKEGLPPNDISQSFLLQADVVVKSLDFGAKMDEVAKEQAACRDCSCCKAQYADER